MSENIMGQTIAVRRLASIRTQIILGFGVVLLLIGVLVVIANLTLQQVQTTAQQAIDESARVRELGLEVQTNFLQARQNEAEFLDNWRLIGYDAAAELYVTAGRENLEQARTNLNELDALVSTAERDILIDLAEDVAEMRPLLDEYEAAFDLTVDRVRQRNQFGGALSVMITTMTTLEALARGFPNPEFIVTLLRVQSNEQAYFATLEPQYIDNVRLFNDAFVTLVETADPDDLRQNNLRIPPGSLINQIEQYEENFFSVVRQEQGILVNAAIFQQITREMEQATADILEKGDADLAAARADLREISELSTTVSTVTGGMALFIGVITAVLLLRRILPPLGRLNVAAQEIAAGRFDQFLPVTGRDEFAVLSQAFNNMTAQLRDLVGSLESRVASRTRDLELAAEVSRGLTQVRDIDGLLTEAGELIRARFDLYYTQIYLVDVNNRYLELHAGTGRVGQELLQRQHRLPLDRPSINATAVLQKEPVIVADTAASPLFRPNILLPETRSEMSVPLLVGDRVVGVLNLQSATAGSLSQENLAAFESMAGQLAIAIENAALFSEISAARTQLEEQARFMSRTGWEQYMDGIRQDEWMGFAHVQGQVAPLAVHQANMDNGRFLTIPITIAGANIGEIALEDDPQREWREDEQELVITIAEQVAQQIENLRLLTETERYRAEAEMAARRLTRDSWRDFLTLKKQETTGFSYDQHRVQSLAESAASALDDHDLMAIQTPLHVGDLEIGAVTVQGIDHVDEDAIDLVTAVTNQLGTHLENIRLSRQTEQALAQAEQRSEELGLINRAVATVSSSLDLQQGLQAVSEELGQAIFADQIGIALLNDAGDGLTVVAEYNPSPDYKSAVGKKISLIGNDATQHVLATGERLVITRDQENPMTASQRELMKTSGFETKAILRMMVGNQPIGTVGIGLYDTNRELSDDQLNLAETIVFQAAASIQNARLFQQAQARARQERILREVTSRVTSAVDAESIMRTAASEISRVLGLETTVYLRSAAELAPATVEPDSPTNGKNGRS